MVLAAAIAAFVAATAGVAALNEFALDWYFQLAWWAYVIGLDDVNRRLAGRSLLRDEPARFARLALGSVVFWTLFEALNLRLGDWYYVMDHPDRAARWAGGVVAFATVLPGIVETEALLAHAGRLRSLRVPRLNWGVRADAACVGLGAACFALPLLWPDAFFPLTWASLALLLEPWNRRHARASFLRELQAGEAGGVVRALLAGLVCGVLWELLNYWARVKWIYTVPGFEDWKLFEMPLLGFLGFPPFALECVVAVRCAEAAWGRLGRRAAAAAALAAALFTLAVFRAADEVSVDSLYVPVRKLSLLAPDECERLAEAGLESPERLLRDLRDAAARRELGRRSGLGEARLAEIEEAVALVMHRGLGLARVEQLGRLGIRSRAQLAARTPEELAAALRSRRDTPRERFLERRARVWLSGAADVATP